MYSNNIVNFQESTTILNVFPKKVWIPIESIPYIRPCFFSSVLYKQMNYVELNWLVAWLVFMTYETLLVI